MHNASPMARTSSFALVDRLLEGTLADTLTDMRNRGMSYDGIARALDKQFDIELSGATVRRWLNRLEQPVAV